MNIKSYCSECGCELERSTTKACFDGIEVWFKPCKCVLQEAIE